MNKLTVDSWTKVEEAQLEPLTSAIACMMSTATNKTYGLGGHKTVQEVYVDAELRLCDTHSMKPIQQSPAWQFTHIRRMPSAPTV